MLAARMAEERFGRYVLLGRLAALSASDVYLASADGQPRTLKLFRPEIAKREFLDMLLRERGAASSFRHPAAVAIFEAGHVSRRAYVSSEVAWGQAWGVVVRRASVAGGALPIRLTRWVGAQIADLLDVASRVPWSPREQSGLLHGRLALGHVLITFSGEVKVPGVGLGRSMQLLPVSPSKLPYRAPEQASHTTDLRSEIYALGVCLYDALTGRTLFRRATPQETLAAIATKPVPALEREVPEAKGPLAELVGRMMARDPEARPTAAEVRKGLLQGLAQPDRARKELSARMIDLFPTELANMRRAHKEAFAGLAEDTSLSRARKFHSMPPPPLSLPEPAETPGRAPNLDSVPSLEALRSAEELPITPAPPPSPIEPLARPKAEVTSLVLRMRVEGPLPASDPAKPPEADEEVTQTLTPRDDRGPVAQAPPKSFGLPEVGERIAGRYVVQSQIGRGGMALVYRVRHEQLGKDMALKLLKPEIVGVSRLLSRFEREARASAKLEHSNIVRVTDFGTTDLGLPFLVMELLRGDSLSSHLAARKRLGLVETAVLGQAILAGLAHAHESGIVHRDMKPDNVILHEHEGRIVPKILDFGIARVRADDGPVEKLTQPGMTLGTPTYMAPEQAAGEEIDPRTDLYAVAAILYELISGSPPFSASTAVQLLAAIVTKPPPPLVAPQLSEAARQAVEAFLVKGLAKSPGRRFQSAAEMSAALGELTVHDLL